MKHTPKQIKAMLKAATPGPWTADGKHVRLPDPYADPLSLYCWPNSEEDATLIAAAPAVIADLLGWAERAVPYLIYLQNLVHRGDCAEDKCTMYCLAMCDLLRELEGE